MPRRVVALLTLAALVLMAGAPLYGMPLYSGEDIAKNENRTLAPFPSGVALTEFPAAFEAYFDDHFAFRSELVGAYNRLQRWIESKADQVVFGKDEWLFYMPDASREDVMRMGTYTPEQLEIICEAQQGARNALADMGAAYVLMICPDKHTIYPEYLPDSFIPGQGESRLDRMLSALYANTDINIVDTRAALLEAKTQQQVFLKTDAHWNAYGGFAAYEQLAEQLEALPGFHRLSRADVQFVDKGEQPGGDLARMVGMTEELTEPIVQATVPGSQVYKLDKLSFKEPSLDPNRRSSIYVNPANPEGPVGVIFMDSFGNRIVPLLREGFSRLTTVWSVSVLEDVVRAEAPDVVIMEYVERLSQGARHGMTSETVQ